MPEILLSKSIGHGKSAPKYDSGRHSRALRLGFETLVFDFGSVSGRGFRAFRV